MVSALEGFYCELVLVDASISVCHCYTSCSLEGRCYFHTHLYICTQVSKLRDFTKQLCCNPEAKVKVVSIFGNTGDGKSHTLNYTFFQGMEVRPLMQLLGGGAVVIMLYV